jgi:hypothetical protein
MNTRQTAIKKNDTVYINQRENKTIEFIDHSNVETPLVNNTA